MAGFQLSKWYMDCVTSSGDASIAYAGSVHWGPVRLHYASLLESTGDCITARHSLRGQAEPNFDRGLLRWQPEALKMDAEWKADSPEIHETIFASDAGSVQWHCLMPRAQARIHDRVGLGYAEHLTITIAPWKLPIRTLRWGRFGTRSDWIVWIDWEGSYSRRIVYRNGQMALTSVLKDCQIEFLDGARLALDRSLVLRAGPLGATALSVIPGVRDTFPARLLTVSECKWRSRATFEGPGKSTVEGWAIHERLDWPN